MNRLNLFLALIIGIVIFSSCSKEQIQAPNVDSKKPQSMSELVASPTFDWKTTKDYHFAFSGQYNEVITVISTNGVIFHKGFVKANVAYKLNLTLPASVKSLHLIYHGQDFEQTLDQLVINHSFNTK